jgi:hypothetical protein
MSSCAVRRWGPGTCKERAPDTATSNELTNKLEQMKKQRDADMQLWSSSKPVSTNNPTINGNK